MFGFLFSLLSELEVETLYISNSYYVGLMLKIKGCSRSSRTSLLDVKFCVIVWLVFMSDYVMLLNSGILNFLCVCLNFENWRVKRHFKVAVDTPPAEKLMFLFEIQVHLPTEAIPMCSDFYNCRSRCLSYAMGELSFGEFHGQSQPSFMTLLLWETFILL